MAYSVWLLGIHYDRINEPEEGFPTRGFVYLAVTGSGVQPEK